jgi:hypothetical protein
VPIDTSKIRSTLLEVVAAAQAATPNAALDGFTILRDSAERLQRIAGDSRLTLYEEQALLSVFHELFRSGHLSWGWNLSNPDPPKFHITGQGQRALHNLSRDPANPRGYLTHLAGAGTVPPIASAYVDEALLT